MSANRWAMPRGRRDLTQIKVQPSALTTMTASKTECLP